MIFDCLCLGILIWIGYCVSGRGAWGAVTAFFTVFFAGLLAMNTFEPMAEWLSASVSSAESWQARWDVISLLGVFGLIIFGLRSITAWLAPAKIPVPQLFEIGFGWLAGLATGYVTIAMLLTALHVAPLPRLVTQEEIIEIPGFQAERAMLFGLAPDRRWWKLNQSLSQHALSSDTPYRWFDGPVYDSGVESGRWPSFPIRYADRRERLTRSQQSRAD